jgi:tetratricopeptide (TPR) repeat protein
MRTTICLLTFLFLGALSPTPACVAADPPAKTGEKRDTLLYVRTVPPGAKVLLDGKELGKSDDLFSVEPGVGKIVVELDGYKPDSKQVTIRGEAVTRIELALKPQGQAAEGTERVYLPDADTKGMEVVLDLATGQKLQDAPGMGDFAQFTRFGKGDLLFDRALICLRGGTAKKWDGMQPVDLPAKARNADATSYELPSVPCHLLITTAEKKRFNVTILEVTKGGINLEYKPLEPGALRVARATVRRASLDRLSFLGGWLRSFAEEYGGKYPDDLVELAKSDQLAPPPLLGRMGETAKEYEQRTKASKEQWIKWMVEDVGYLGKGKTPEADGRLPIAYDKAMLKADKGTNVLFNNGQIEFVPANKLKDRGVIESAVTPKDATAGKTPAANSGNAAQLSQQGWQLWQKGQWDEAAERFTEAVKLDPKNQAAWNGLGWATFNSGKMPEAEQAFKRVIAMNPKHPGGLNGLGQLYLAQKKYDLAEKYLLKAAPQAPAAWHGLARLYLLQGKFAQAEKYAQMIVDSGQGDKLTDRMLQAAKEKRLGEGLRFMLDPPQTQSEPGVSDEPVKKTPTANGKHAEAEKQAVEAAEAWLLLVDAGKYAEGWDEAAERLKKAVSKDAFTQSAGAVRQPLGDVKSRKIESQRYLTQLPGAPDSEYVVIQYKTSFANKESATETITPTLGKDKKWRVSGYYIK